MATHIPVMLLRCVLKSFSRVQLFGTPWTVPHQAPLSVGFSRQEYWSGLPFPSSGDLTNPGIKSVSPILQADSLPAESRGKLEYIDGYVHLGNLCLIGTLRLSPFYRRGNRLRQGKKLARSHN